LFKPFCYFWVIHMEK